MMSNGKTLNSINYQDLVFYPISKDTYLPENRITIQNEEDYECSIELITELQELIEIEEAKIRDYFNRINL